MRISIAWKIRDRNAKYTLHLTINLIQGKPKNWLLQRQHIQKTFSNNSFFLHEWLINAKQMVSVPQRPRYSLKDVSLSIEIPHSAAHYRRCTLYLMVLKRIIWKKSCKIQISIFLNHLTIFYLCVVQLPWGCTVEH